MLKMIYGAKIKDFDKLNEEYEINGNAIFSNVNGDKILNMFYEFIDMHEGLFFLIIEVPSNLKDEQVKGNNTLEKTHKDIYYKDGMSKEFAKEILSTIGNLFINDGLAQIGIGSHNSNAEIITNKYNVIQIYPGNNNIKDYENLFIKNNIKKVDSLKTAWDFFTKENPGESTCIEEDGKTVFDAVEMLKNTIELYFAEKREN